MLQHSIKLKKAMLLSSLSPYASQFSKLFPGDFTHTPETKFLHVTIILYK